MLSVSENFLNLMQSNIRPKIEPTITVKGQDSEGNQVVLTWKPSNIQNMTYKRGIDPVGRTLPYMELTWTEIYYGKLNEQNYPEKYNNVIKYMAVELSFEQSLGFFNTWKELYSADYTWKDLFEQFKTWKSVKRGVSKETVKLPTMFLVAKPTIQGQTITWTARDLFYFLNQKHSKSFEDNVDFINPIRWLLLDERANFRNSNEIFEALTQTQNSVKEYEATTLSGRCIFDNSTKNLLMNYASNKNFYWDFKNNYAVLRSFEKIADGRYFAETLFDFTGNIMREYPTLTEQLDVSGYSFKRYNFEIDEEANYNLSSQGVVDYKGEKFYKFQFKGLGVPSSNSGNSLPLIAKQSYDSVETITVSPVSYNNYEEFISTGKTGEIFTEDNPLNTGYSVTSRVDLLKRWFGKERHLIEVDSLSNVALETGDFVGVETNLFNNKDERIIKKAIVVGIELSYNGGLKQKTLLHEVIYNEFWG